MPRGLERLRNALDDGFEPILVAARRSNRLDQRGVQCAERTLDDGLDQQVAIAEMMEHRWMREAGIGSDFLQPDPRRSREDEAFLGRIEDDLASSGGIEPSTRLLCGRCCAGHALECPEALLPTSLSAALLTTLSIASKCQLEPMLIQFAPRRAFRAARTLAANPDDLPQVFTIIEALSVDTILRMTRRLGRSAAGRRLTAEQPDIVRLLADREALARLPEGSLGRAYLAFVEREQISAEGIRAAQAKGTTNDVEYPPPIDWIRARMRDTHDLWHAVTGYSGDLLGESALLAFIFAQTYNPGVALILCIGMVKTVLNPLGGAPARRTILDGFRRGRNAAWLPEQEWESMLALPLEEVRKRLRLEEPAVYTPIRTADLKAAA